MNKLHLTIVFLFFCVNLKAQKAFQKLEPVNFSQVNVTDPFWKNRMDVVASATLEACINYTENKTGRIRNFENAAHPAGKKHEGIYYDDSDVFKALEAMAYSLKNKRNDALEKKADEWIDKIVAAQMPDGYLNTYYILTDINGRWTDMDKHEDYCAGHLIEAAIAYYNTTGKDKLLNCAIRFANHIDSIFRIPNRHWVSGHEEIELALMSLYHHTNNDRYLKLAQWFVEQRGHGYGKGPIWQVWNDPSHCQDQLPVKQQTKITGHAVRAMYLYTGVADIAAVTKDQDYIQTMNSIWDDVINRHLYITGGIGAQGKNEGFGEPYVLPNETAYCETCASVGMVFWNQRMNMLTGDAKYIDILERSLYNGAMAGLSLSGNHFFYENPLASEGKVKRREWFGTACCPSNIARLVSSLGNYIYATSDNNTLWVNLYIGSNTTVPLKRTNVNINTVTGLPWKGNVSIEISPKSKQTFDVRLRIPGWITQPVPGNLYTYTTAFNYSPLIKVNEKEVKCNIENGYAVISRTWNKGDVITIDFPMNVREIIASEQLKNDDDKIAFQYGPMVYCMEEIDNAGKVYNTIVDEASRQYKVLYEKDLLSGVNTISFNANTFKVSADGRSILPANETIKLVPYFAWNNRDTSMMQVWLPTKISTIKIE